MLSNRRALDYRLLTVVLALLAAGLGTLYSAGQTDVPTAVAEVWKRQLVWVLLGVVGAAVAYRASPRLLEWVAPVLYGLAIGLLVITLLVGVGGGTAAGTKSWLAIGGIRLGQPSEFAKLATILMLARSLGGRRRPATALVETLPAVLIVTIPFVLVALQPDLGSAIVFVTILFAALYWGGVRPSLLLLLASPFISLLLAFSTVSWGIWIVLLTVVLLWVRPYVLEAVVVWFANALMGITALGLWQQLQPYQQNRLLSFLNPEIDPRATGWHIIQSKVAIGSGGILGKGFTEGTQKRLAFLPAQHTDFVYSVVGEELGFIGVVVTLALLAALVLAMVRIARTAGDPFSSLVVFGLASMLLTHILVNVGMTVGLMPITGIPLPFFSYGGSFMLTCLVAVGITLRISREGQGL